MDGAALRLLVAVAAAMPCALGCAPAGMAGSEVTADGGAPFRAATTADCDRASCAPDDFGAPDGVIPSGPVQPEDGATPAAGACSGTDLPIAYRAPNVLIVLDRSCSMRRRLDAPSRDGTGPDDVRTKWYAAREAIHGMLAQHPGKLRWGLMVYPDPFEGCGSPIATEVPPADGTEPAIRAQLADALIQPFGICDLGQPHQTPTAEALESVLGVAALRGPERPSFAILVTDGAPGCGATESTLADLGRQLLDANIPTAVVGFAAGSNTEALEALAQASGLPRPGANPSYYKAESAAELEGALDAITGLAVSCTVDLEAPPPAGEELFVSLDEVPLAPADYRYDAASNQIVLLGDACDRLRAGDVTRIGLSARCPTTTCTPSSEACNGLDDDCDGDVDEACATLH
jgi:hypothetical protein